MWPAVLCSRLTNRLHGRSAGLTSWLLERAQLRAPITNSCTFSTASPESYDFASASAAMQQEAGAKPHSPVRCVCLYLKAHTQTLCVQLSKQRVMRAAGSQKGPYLLGAKRVVERAADAHGVGGECEGARL